MNTQSIMRTSVFGKCSLKTSLCLLSLVLLWTAVPAQAQNPGAPSGNGIQPSFVAGNPDCGDIGLGFGFKIDGSANGTYTLTAADGALTGGAPSDPGNSVTISNSDGSFFDWAATLGIDAVIVKAGPNANVFAYSPEAVGDTLLHGPINPNNDAPFGVSHIELCYDYEVDVAKNAATTFTRTWHWSIDKAVSPVAWELFTGDAGTSKYKVSVDRTGFTDSDWAVSGQITIDNDTPFDATITGVSDVISPSLAVAVDCGTTFPHVLASGDSLVCSYASPLPDGASRVNTATVTTSGVVGGNQATAPVTFGTPTTEVNASINVVDTNGLSWGPVSDDMMWMYERTFGCDGDQGTHGNTATIVETGQSDDASVTVICRGLEVTKNAATSFTRTWDWALDKTADQTELTLSPGQSFDVTYWVDVTADPVDSDWAASGEIWVTNNHPSRSAMLVSVGDVISVGIDATVDCPALVVAPGAMLHCTYSADLPDGSDRTNTATATLQNVSIASDGTVTPTGTTGFDSAGVAVIFGDPDTVIDACIDVSDSLEGVLGTVCAAEAPTSFHYPHTIGPFESPDECGEHEVVNVASFVAQDSGATGEDSWTVLVDVVCEDGCTLTPGYWKTHSEFGPAPFDDTWNELADGASTVFFLSGQSWYEVLWTPPKGNAYYILARAYMAASLNFLNGASAPPEVLDAWNEATDLFETYTPADIDALRGNRPPRPRFLELAGLLDMYNNGLLGPGHCSEDSSSAP